MSTPIRRLVRSAALFAASATVAVAFVACSSGDGAGEASGATNTGNEIGQQAPDFSLVRADTGEAVALSDLRGKTVIVNFWATWCAPCRAEMPDLEAAHQERLEAGDLVILGVNQEESAERVNEFVEDLGLTFPIVLDSDAAVRKRYSVLGLPATFFIDRDGIIRARAYGPVFGNLLPDGIAAADRAGES